jgi:hypothetical protein
MQMYNFPRFIMADCPHRNSFSRIKIIVFRGGHLSLTSSVKISVWKLDMEIKEIGLSINIRSDSDSLNRLSMSTTPMQK